MKAHDSKAKRRAVAAVKELVQAALQLADAEKSLAKEDQLARETAEAAAQAEANR